VAESAVSEVRRGTSTKVLLIVAAVLVLALATFGTVRAIQLQEEVSDLRSEVAAARQDAETGQSDALRETEVQLAEARTEVERLTAKVKLIEDCLPEVQDQIVFLTVDEFGSVFSSRQPSRFCESTLYGENGFGSPPGE
jgi:uncharacterized protein HemX